MISLPFRLLTTVAIALFFASKWVRRAVAAVAVSAVECWLVSLVVGEALGLGRPLPNNLVIITGRGSHSDDGDARLRNVTLRLLNHQLQPGLRASVDESNAGRVIVRKADLEAWARAALL